MWQLIFVSLFVSLFVRRNDDLWTYRDDGGVQSEIEAERELNLHGLASEAHANRRRSGDEVFRSLEAQSQSQNLFGKRARFSILRRSSQHHPPPPRSPGEGFTHHDSGVL